ncbi:NUDIX domain-containing protein [Mycoplasmopsis cynos]|uniref:NUDIX domain-containing protein n=1 Tax=Mycoplasmopsis cynos TaxID=171284 RepID=UPI0021F9EBDD|nr:NUDIX domain-containing protein [Mycoplasmopsis cynos]UWV82647.1 NUDIX domain-containing protein [Mycoplasmopsis cynos]
MPYEEVLCLVVFFIYKIIFRGVNMDVFLSKENYVFKYRVGVSSKMMIKFFLRMMVKLIIISIFQVAKVEFGESIYQAIEREINEELKVKPSEIKLLFANELFYYSKISEKNVRELCFYFLLDLDLNSEILQNKFYTIENNRKLFFEWVKINELEKINFKPGEIIKHIINPPNEFKIFNTNEKNQAH